MFQIDYFFYTEFLLLQIAVIGYIAIRYNRFSIICTAIIIANAIIVVNVKKDVKTSLFFKAVVICCRMVFNDFISFVAVNPLTVYAILPRNPEQMSIGSILLKFIEIFVMEQILKRNHIDL